MRINFYKSNGNVPINVQLLVRYNHEANEVLFLARVVSVHCSKALNRLWAPSLVDDCAEKNYLSW